MFNLLTYPLDLPRFNNIEDLSYLTGLSTNQLYSLSKNSHIYYRIFKIPKHDGSSREIYSPTFKLYVIQRWILKNIINKISPSKYAMAFRKGTTFGCKANANNHIDTDYAVSFDLENFFTNINSKRIYNIFASIGYEKLPATILTNLCTFNNFLPQGGPCSPALSNLVCLSLDHRLAGLCEKRCIHFTRYADDMYFSCDSQDILKKSVPFIRKIILDEGFIINEKKTKYFTPSNRKHITGITIINGTKDSIPENEKLKASKTLKRKIRAEIYNAIYSGDYSNKDHILGEISYVNYIEPSYKNKIKVYINNTASKIDVFKELVEKYNSNLFFKDLEQIKFFNINDSKYKLSDDEINHYLYLKEERIEFLNKRHFTDICTYIDWPNFPKFNDDYEDFPF